MEIISLLRVDFDNLTSPSEKFKLTSNSGFVLAVVSSPVELGFAGSILVGLPLEVHRGLGFCASVDA